MSLEKFNDDCSGCRPVIIDIKTGAVLPDDDPYMKRVLEVWAVLTREEKEAWHAVTCQNSRDPWTLEVVQDLVRRMTPGGGP